MQWVIVADGSGNSYVTGVRQDDFIHVKYNPAGEFIWISRSITVPEILMM